jgi:uncharacterized protein involved in exopolysaccharide biosynthesis
MPQSPSLKEAPPESSGGSFDIFEIVLYGLGRYRWWIIPFATIGLAVGVVRSLMVPNTYLSNGEMFINLGMRESVTPETVIGGPAHTILLSDELHVLKSPELFEKVARTVGADRILEPYDPTRYDDLDARPTQPAYWKHKLHALQKRLFNRGRPAGKIDPESMNQVQLAGYALATTVTIRAGALTQVLTISARAKSPELAQDIVDATMQAAKERHREVFSNQFNQVFVTEQIEKAETDLEDVTTEFYEHRQGCGFFDIVKQRNQIFTDLAQIENTIAASSLRLAEIKTDRDLTTEKLQNLPLKVTELREPKPEPNPTWTKYQDQRLALEEKRASLAKTYREGTDDYEKIEKVLKDDLALLDKFLEGMPPLIIVGEPYTVEVDNPDRKAAEKKLQDLDVEQEMLLTRQTREADRRISLGERMDALLACEPLHERLQGEIGQLVSQINKFKDAMAKAQTLALVDQDLAMSNLRVLDHASFNPRKVAPQRSKSVITGLGAGIGIWAAFALLRQFLDVKVRFPKNVERTLGVKVLGIVPEQRRWKRLGKRLRARVAA